MRSTLACCLLLAACGDDGLKQLQNRPPNAVIFCPSTVGVGEAVNCTAMSSTDPDGDSITFDWDFGDGASANGTSVSHTFAAMGEYTVEVIARDSAGATDTDSTTVTVETPNAPPVAVITGPTTAFVGVTASFDASSSHDPDGTIAGYLWDFGDGSTAATATFGKTWNSVGSLTVTLTVTDNLGKGGQATQLVTVTEPSYNGMWNWGLVNESDRSDSGCGPFYDSVLQITVNGAAITIVENPGSNSVTYTGTITGNLFSATNSGLGMTQIISGTFTTPTHFDGNYHVEGLAGLCNRDRAVKGDKQ
jgi:PKD repeat protein